LTSHKGVNLFSIGHSSLSLVGFLSLMQSNEIDVVADVRSHPYSRLYPHFNRQNLDEALKAEGVKYLYLGRELGGKPGSNEFYDIDGHVLYGASAQSPQFIEGIGRLKKGVQNHRIAIMCSEGDPRNCHGRLLIGHVLAQDGIEIAHIRADGYLQTEDDIKREESGEGIQLPMFDHEEATNWRSVKPIRLASPNEEQQVSSAP
jgi:uncharacterized protein (DUF488 family)